MVTTIESDLSRRFLSRDRLGALQSALDAGYVLPSEWYMDPDLYERECELVLRKGWHYACHIDEIGTKFALDVAGAPIVIVRDAPNKIRGFMKDAPHLPIQVQQWGPMIWVNLDLGAPNFDNYANNLRALVAENGMNLDDFRYSYARDWPIQSNWKVYLDNSCECYHCPTCHPQVNKAMEMDVDKQGFFAHRNWITHIIPIKPFADYRKESAGLLYHFHWIFPMTFGQYSEERRGFDIGSARSISVDHIELKNVFFVRKDMSKEEEEMRRLRQRESTVVAEDVAICERVQEAHATRIAPTGRILPSSEWFILHFQQRILDMMAEQK
jgi:phenylpropionate dioxygenase-like ring-hydroxylating dioxygenase large terminal subunit